jgi:hypothetical protein
MAADHVRRADVPLATAIASLRRCGIGSGALLGEMSAGAAPP